MIERPRKPIILTYVLHAVTKPTKAPIDVLSPIKGSRDLQILEQDASRQTIFLVGIWKQPDSFRRDGVSLTVENSSSSRMKSISIAHAFSVRYFGSSFDPCSTHAAVTTRGLRTSGIGIRQLRPYWRGDAPQPSMMTLTSRCRAFLGT